MKWCWWARGKSSVLIRLPRFAKMRIFYGKVIRVRPGHWIIYIKLLSSRVEPVTLMSWWLLSPQQITIIISHCWHPFLCEDVGTTVIVRRDQNWNILTCNSRADPPGWCGQSSPAWDCSAGWWAAAAGGWWDCSGSHCHSSLHSAHWGPATERPTGSPPSPSQPRTPGWTGARGSSPSSPPPCWGWWCSGSAGQPAQPWRPAAGGTRDWGTSLVSPVSPLSSQSWNNAMKSFPSFLPQKHQLGLLGSQRGQQLYSGWQTLMDSWDLARPSSGLASEVWPMLSPSWTLTGN